MTTLLAAVFVLGVLIFVHELGHFVVAKLSGIKVERFSLGFPPTLISKKIGETEYSLSLIPIGGYVKMAGEDPTMDQITGAPNEFQSQSLPTKLMVVGAGPMMNLVLAVVIFWGLLYFNGQTIINTSRIEVLEPRSGLGEVFALETGDSIIALNNQPIHNWQDFMEALPANAGHPGLTMRVIRRDQSLDLSAGGDIIKTINDGNLGIYPLMTPQVDEVEKGSPADRFGLRSGDMIISVHHTPVQTYTQLKEIISRHPDDSLNLQYMRNDSIHSGIIVPQRREVPGDNGSHKVVGIIGIMGHLPFTQQELPFGRSFIMAIEQSYKTVAQMLTFLKQLIFGQISAKYVGGPVYIIQLSGKMAQAGLESLLSFIALISLNLALLNLLPIPALDGGHILVFLIEAVIRHPLSLKQKSIIQYTGFGLLIIVTVMVTFNDILRLMQ
ncbi:MAG: RIP metalloprotease RseP [Candidatus Delongbacteria bacterium]|nr:RIP metalloprotease RseP [Candidatus Delongbacteria bacterium]